MNKFTVVVKKFAVELDENKPVLYKVYIGSCYYLHKGKKLKESYNKLLDDIFRGIREIGKRNIDKTDVKQKYDERYSNIINYCIKYPAIHKVYIEVISNDIPSKLLKLEDKLYKEMEHDELSLNRTDLGAYKPEWMLKQVYQERCNECVKNGVVGTKKTKFKFCPMCGRLNK
jgi:hypothetical protein